MDIIINFLKKKKEKRNFWVRNGFIIVILSIFINHLTEPENFPLNKSYEFPWLPIVSSIIVGSIVLIIASFNFKYFKNKYFTKKIDTQILVRFLFSTLGYITILYIPIYYVLNGLINGTESYSIYHLLTGLSISLLMCTLGVALLFLKDIYKLHKLISIKGTLKVQQSGKITLVKYPEIAFIHSENKIVYIVKTDGTTIITDFTLNEVESKISQQSFFRVNRQIILHARSIEQVQSIENGKLSVILKSTFSDKKTSQINISRYKRQAFMDWFDKKL
ncbi:LytTR family DNA-binding domain-containing protein [Aquimarina sp. 2201CG5-10]|uniref:LytR/AlgR family response regulator transcription factor n=1 Tax=Aquimarina callyspongiae TaxID=3098150 RepID=UPI002AB5217A|nr:LytTR family DNA-binding domain-containing protein [Aquimarina sp. 2201CG5-10]MDY8135419.1 LytTR family DNA-binding domain-containing protein [Aquimarina sp. 2201CG5-10]